MSVPGIFQKITSVLDQVGIAYMLSGSFASAYYGALRSTQDIDLVIEATPVQLKALIQNLPADQYYADLNAAVEAHERQSMFNVIDMASGWKVDLIIRKSRAFSREEFRRRQQVNLQGLNLFVASAEDVIIAKLEWSKLAQSVRQIEDVVAILRVRWELLDRVYLEKWIQELDLQREWDSALQKSGMPG